MSLYDDILPADELKSDKDTGKSNKIWSNSSMNLLQHHLQNRKQQPKPSNQFKPRQTIYKPNNKSSNTTNISNSSKQTFTNSSKYTGSLLGGEWNVSLEYDPFWPNDYEKIMKERKEKEKSMTAAKVITTPTSAQFKSFTPPIVAPVLFGSRPLVDGYSDDDDDDDESKKSQKGVSIAPPPSLMESSTSNTTTTTSFNSVPPVQYTENTNTTSLNMTVSDVAAKIMAKMGYKEGQGLGKNQQGIATALQVEKTSKNSGVIIANTSVVTNTNKADEFAMPMIPTNQPTTTVEQPQESITEIMKNPTRVIMLRNMVGQGEVDPDLKPEVIEECSKFGEVCNCLIYEVNEGLVNSKLYPNLKNQQVPDDSAVRIFVEFVRVESAIKALIDLNGRYFGGRVVRGQFYNLDKFKKMDLFSS